MSQRLDILEQQDQIEQWIQEKRTKAFICNKLHCKPETLNSYLKKMGIEYKGQPGLKDKTQNNLYKTAEEYAKSNNVKSSKLKEKLIKEGIKKDECEICGISYWQGVKLTLELHHIDGNHFNNSFDNLQILCPNCHSIQPNDTFKNVGSYNNLCIDCGKPIDKRAQRCKSCAAKQNNLSHRKVKQLPSREELKNMIRYHTFTDIGVKYKVSDNAVRKWCVKYNLPKRKKDIESYTDEEWAKI